jgi:hypothetical protein
MFSAKCNINFETQYAHIDDTNEPIHIYDYIKTECKDIPKCINGHELCSANGKIKKPYFRHKNNEDVDGNNPMTKWHCEWQGNFPKTERPFPKINDTQKSDRRADVVIQKFNTIIEIQHSPISPEEVKNRKHDYELNNHITIWIIHGNDTIRVTHLKHSMRIYLEFTKDRWKYKSFTEYEFIFVDIDGLIYKVYPNDVKNDMIDVNEPFEKDTFINYLNNNDNILYENNKPEQSQLYIKQQGAGNGKTFGIIQMLESYEFEHYECIICVTKQHSAKYVIYNELIQQVENKHLKYIKDIQVTDEKKKYIITYTSEKTNKKCKIIIGTIDSLMYALGNKNHTDLHRFEGLVHSIIDGYIESEKLTSVTYAGGNFKLDKKMCFMADEFQDLSIDYGKAFIQIMRDRYIDAYIVGDKLQSLVYNNNAFAYLYDNDFSYINKKLYDPTNVCRRFYNKDLVDFVNTIIPFNKYSLPTITPYKEDIDNVKGSLTIFEGETIYADNGDDNKLNKEVEKIIELYNYEVITYNRKPNDFLIITPFTKKNPLANAIQTALNIYWGEKTESNDYNRFAIFHKSEEGTSIDLSESDNATRIVSIHTSKGDGRSVVFVIGLDESSLKKYSDETGNLIYSSLLHVSVTRMKEKLYYRLVNNGDDISQKLSKYLYDNDICTIKPSLNINMNCKYDTIVDFILRNDTNFEILQKEIINNTHYSSQLFNENEKQIIDMYHHNIRYASMFMYFIIKVINTQNGINSEIKKQFRMIFIDLMISDLVIDLKWQDYYNDIKSKKIAILQQSNKGRDYIKYCNIVYKMANNIITNIKKNINSSSLEVQCPLEMIILYYLIEIKSTGMYASITIDELYNIIDIYNKSYTSSCKGHQKCLCSKYFENKHNIDTTNSKVQTLSKYLLNHYEASFKTGLIYDSFMESHSKVNWLLNHTIYYTGTNKDYNIYKMFSIIGYDDTTVYVIYIKPQLNDLNYNEFLMTSIYDTFIIQNIREPLDINDKHYEKHLNDYKKFGSKTIQSIVFTADNDKYYTYKWSNSANDDLIHNNKNILIEQLSNGLIDKYLSESNAIFNFYKYHKRNSINTIPDKIIKDIINAVKTELNKFPDKLPPYYVFKFFEGIGFALSREKNNKVTLLNMYDDREYFNNELKEVITESVNDYFGIDN